MWKAFLEKIIIIGKNNYIGTIFFMSIFLSFLRKLADSIDARVENIKNYFSSCLGKETVHFPDKKA